LAKAISQHGAQERAIALNRLKEQQRMARDNQRRLAQKRKDREHAFKFIQHTSSATRGKGAKCLKPDEVSKINELALILKRFGR
jgi:trimethylamine:corrinoid methyltransferase-like protein